MHLLPASLRQHAGLGLLAALACALPLPGSAQAAPTPAPRLKEEMRMPWTRSQERFIRRWLVLGEIPLAATGDAFAQDPFAAAGGEAALQAADKKTQQLPDGSAPAWRPVTSWGDAINFSDADGLKRNVAWYAFATVAREGAGKALLCLGSNTSIRAWVNGALVLDWRGTRSLTFDEHQVEVDLKSGDNRLLVKLEQRNGPWTFAARVLEHGAIPPRVQEIGPSLFAESPSVLTVKTDINREHASEDQVTVQAVVAGGRVLATQTASRGDSVHFDPAGWPDGPYEFRCTTRKADGLLTATHLSWFKGDAIAAARELVVAGKKADVSTPAGFTVKMLADMALDRLGKEGLTITGNPWWAVHSPLMEYAELKLEAAGDQSARARAYGFVRLAWRDEIDGSPQFARAYLPGGYDPAKKWPLVLKLHGYNPPNPEYVRWWAADSRHSLADAEYARHEGIIYLEPHGRGNTQYLGFGDQDVVRAIQLAKARFNVDEDRVYLCGDSMGGWGAWNVATRHPGLFAAIAPIFGGADYHSYLTEEQLAALNPLTRFLQDKNSTWSPADSLLNLPILVLHGDVDQSVNVDWSRYGVRQLQRWGYNVRYLELPGYGHEDLNRFPAIFNWFLAHRRDAQPRRVRIRSAELPNASAYWAAVEMADQPDRFMVVDAEVIAPNTIRVDSQNVVALTLSPGPALIDPAKSVTIVWNGEQQKAAIKDGSLKLRAPGLVLPSLAKNSRLAGPLGDIFNTPFAIVTGTASGDPAMNAACRQKAELLVNFWQEWQRQPPRSFKDSEITDEDAARYSLILIGGPETNLVTRKLADRLPFRLSGDQITIGGRSFAATDARVQLIYPHPLNSGRYVLVVAATSAAGMNFWSPGGLRGAEFDFTIDDCRVAGIGQQADRTDLWVAGGWFNRAWALEDAFVHPGKTEARAAAVVLGDPLEPKLLDAYVGRYQIAPEMVCQVTRMDSHLTAKVGEQPSVDLIPAGDNQFYIPEGPMLVVFERDPSGKVTAFKSSQNGREFSGKKAD